MFYRVDTLLFCFLIVFCGSGAVQAQQYGTLPDTIPESYSIDSSDRTEFPDASAVVRLGARRLVVEDINESTLYVRKVVTIFDEKGRSHGRHVIPYDSFVEIEDLDGAIYDEEGNEVKELDDDDITDRSAIQSISLYDDNRVRVLSLFEDTYPYTVEYRYELEFASPFWWPTWYPEGPRAPTEFAQYEVDVPRALDIRYRVQRDSIDARVQTTDERKIVRWRVANRPAYSREPYGPSWWEQAPSVRVAPTIFSVSESTGDMRSWESFGRWYHNLKDGRDELDRATAQEMHHIVEGASTRRDSIRRLYRHLQKEARYVSVQLGIGGWQPFPPSYVRDRGYGDCKALTNYMEASLEAVGISAHPVLISAGEDPRPVLKDFPSNQFNHAVLAVPVEGDTLWLENTDMTAPFGHVAASIEDRYALMVTPAGGELVRTPASRAEKNRQTRMATVTLTAEGHASAQVRTIYTGNQQDRVRQALTNASSRRRRAWLRDRIDIPSFDLRKADFSDVDAYRDTVRLPLQLHLSRYAARTGPRLFLPLNVMQRWGDVPPEMEENRTQPVQAARYPFVDVDSVRFEIPAGYDVEALPDPVSVETDFATYTASTRYEEGVLLYHRRLEWHKKELPADRYEAFRSFRQNVARADEVQAVLVKENT